MKKYKYIIKIATLSKESDHFDLSDTAGVQNSSSPMPRTNKVWILTWHLNSPKVQGFGIIIFNYLKRKK
jgi:hypothetical protein